MTDGVWLTTQPSGLVGGGVFRYDSGGTPDPTTPFFADVSLDGPGDLGHVVNAGVDEVWICDDQTTVPRFGVDTHFLSTITNASFNFPSGVLYLPSIGKVWIAGGGPTIFVYNPDGTNTGVTYTPDAALFTGNMCLGPDGAVWLGNIGSAAFTIYRLTTAGAPYAGGNIAIAGYATTYGVITVGANVWTTNGGTIYVLDSSGATVTTIVDPTGGALATLCLVGTEVWAPGGFSHPRAVYRFDAATYAPLATITNSGFAAPWAACVVPGFPAPTVPVHAWYLTPVLALAPGVPAIVSPQINFGSGFFSDVGPSLTTADPVTYTWTSVLLGATYRLQVSTDPTFATTLHDVSGISATTYAETTTLLDATVYYWRVRATAGGVTGPWSYIGWFVVLDSYTSVSPTTGSTVHATLSGGIYQFAITWTAAGVETHTYDIRDSSGHTAGFNLGVPPLGEGSTVTGPFSWQLARSLVVSAPAGGVPGIAVTMASAPTNSATITLVYP